MIYILPTDMTEEDILLVASVSQIQQYIVDLKKLFPNFSSNPFMSRGQQRRDNRTRLDSNNAVVGEGGS